MATRTQSTVVAIFRNTSDAQAAAEELQANGFSQDEIFMNYAGGTDTSVRDAGPRQHEGGIAGWFKRVFGSDDESDQRYYEDAVSSGNVLLGVDTNEENVDTAADILNRYSPLDVHREGEGSSSGATASGITNASTETARSRTSTADETRAIPVVQEELRVGKRTVLRGGVRVYSRVVDQPVEETVNLQEERVRVDRQPVNRPVKESDLRSGRDEVIEVQEYGEEPVVSKDARVVEEVRVNKEATQRQQTVKDTVRRTEVNVENLGQQSTTGSALPGDIDKDFRSHFSSHYGSSGVAYDTYEPAYRYGYDAASDPRYQGKNFNEVESDLRSSYARRYPNSTWEKIKDSVRYGWDKITGRSSSATTSR